MYQNLCCYCEGEVRAVGADQIEHRRPVDSFPESAFEWDNLHLACAGCNRAKSAKWNNNNPILDAVIDDPITDHLDYEPSQTGMRRTCRSKRGDTTVTHADLNRGALREARAQVFMGVFGVIRKIQHRLGNNSNDLEALNMKAQLEEMCEGRYGTMIRWAIDELLDC